MRSELLMPAGYWTTTILLSPMPAMNRALPTFLILTGSSKLSWTLPPPIIKSGSLLPLNDSSLIINRFELYCFQMSRVDSVKVRDYTTFNWAIRYLRSSDGEDAIWGTPALVSSPPHYKLKMVLVKDTNQKRTSELFNWRQYYPKKQGNKKKRDNLYIKKGCVLRDTPCMYLPNEKRLP